MNSHACSSTRVSLLFCFDSPFLALIVYNVLSLFLSVLILVPILYYKSLFQFILSSSSFSYIFIFLQIPKHICIYPFFTNIYPFFTNLLVKKTYKVKTWSAYWWLTTAAGCTHSGYLLKEQLQRLQKEATKPMRDLRKRQRIDVLLYIS